MSPVADLMRRLKGISGQTGEARAPWVPAHRHCKGGLYRVIRHGMLEADHSEPVICDEQEGTVWIHPWPEFADGRFEPLSGA